MLSRVADSLYWMGRYLERAENVSRLLLVTGETAVELEGLDEAQAQAEWDELLAAVGGGDHAKALEFSREHGLALPYVKYLLLDDTLASAVLHAISRARENARSIREVLTREVFENLNESHRELQRLRRRGLRGPVEAAGELAVVHRNVLTTLGSIEHTLTRDQGWTFMKLGEAMERTLRTLLVLRAKLPALLVTPEADLPLLHARWRGLLRSVASLENYRAAQGPSLDPESVVRFLFLHPAAPRTVLCGVRRIRGYLDQLPGGEAMSEADRVLGRLHGTLTYDDAQILPKHELASFCAETATHLATAHDAIARQYFPV